MASKLAEVILQGEKWNLFWDHIPYVENCQKRERKINYTRASFTTVTVNTIYSHFKHFALLRWIKAWVSVDFKGGGLKWEKSKVSPRWQFKVNCKQEPCKIQLKYIIYVCHVTNHAQFSTKCIDSKFPLFSNELLNQFCMWIMTDNIYFETPPGMRQNDFICS